MVDLEALTQAGETASLILITVAFLFFLFLAVRSRSYKSLQFQIFVVTVVLFVAEVPKMLWTLGLADFTDIDVLGLEIHTLSMFLLVGFLAWKIYGFLKVG